MIATTVPPLPRFIDDVETMTYARQELNSDPRWCAAGACGTLSVRRNRRAVRKLIPGAQLHERRPLNATGYCFSDPRSLNGNAAGNGGAASSTNARGVVGARGIGGIAGIGGSDIETNIAKTATRSVGQQACWYRVVLR